MKQQTGPCSTGLCTDDAFLIQGSVDGSSFTASAWARLPRLIYLAGPLVSIGDYHPLQTMIGREIAILAVGAIFAAVMSFQWQRRKKATAKIAEGIAGRGQARRRHRVLKGKMKDALATLKTRQRRQGRFSLRPALVRR